MLSNNGLDYEGNIYELMLELEQAKRDFSEAISESNASKAGKIGGHSMRICIDIIKRPQQEREEYFLKIAQDYLEALDEEDFELSRNYHDELRKYQEYFLNKQTFLGRMSLRDNNAIRRIIRAYSNKSKKEQLN